MDDFLKKLQAEFLQHASNHHTDNFDVYRYGTPSLSKRIKRQIKALLVPPFLLHLLIKNNTTFISLIKNQDRKVWEKRAELAWFYNHLADEASKKLLLTLLTFRVLGHTKVRLPFHTSTYWDDISELEEIASALEHWPIKVRPYTLKKLNLSNIDSFPIQLFYTAEGVYRGVVCEHYKYANASTTIQVESGDVVLDLGGCFGDTALYFAHKTGEDGQVYSFEFIPGNYSVIEKNLSLNPHLSPHVYIVKAPVWERSAVTAFFTDNGPGSRVSFEDFDGSEGSAQTLSIDDFVALKKLHSVDFIKMDIEGAEPFAIAGATETLRKHTPKLALSIYHGMNDFVQIIRQIHELNLGYRFYLGHASIHVEETVLFCVAE